MFVEYHANYEVVLISFDLSSVHTSQLCYLRVAVDHLEPAGHHGHEGLVLLPVLAPPPGHQRRVRAQGPPLPAGLSGRPPGGVARRGEVAQTSPVCPGLQAQVGLVDVGHRDPGREEGARHHVGDGAERGGARHVGQQARVLLGHDGVTLGVVTGPQLALSPQTKPGNSDDKQEEARDGGDHDVEHTGVAINTVDHGSFCGKLFLKRKTLATASRGIS